MSITPFSRTFPTEVFGVILSHADRGTVAVCSRVCLAFLEYSGLLLYKHVTIDREGQLVKLLCGQATGVPATGIAPHVSLSQIQTFTIRAEDDKVTFWTRRRLPQGSPLRVARLDITPVETLTSGSDADLASEPRVQNRARILSLFDPVLFVCRVPEPLPHRTFNSYRRTVRSHFGRFLFWPRLERVVYVGGLFVCLDDGGVNACVPYETRRSQGFAIELDLTQVTDHVLVCQLAYRLWVGTFHLDALSYGHGRPRGIEVMLPSEEASQSIQSLFASELLKWRHDPGHQGITFTVRPSL